MNTDQINWRYMTLSALLLLAAQSASANCGASVCLLNTDWDAQGISSAPGLRVDMRLETITQDKLREGTRVVGAQAVTDEVVPLKTHDRNALLTLDYPLNQHWAVHVDLPWVQRTHTQLTRNEDGSQTINEFKLSGLGDMRVTGRYALLGNADVKTGGYGAGLSLGIKLPTGRHKVIAPNAQLAEPGLQPGTGTTDAVMGVYYNQQSIQSNWGYFARAQFQAAVNSKDEFRPGNKYSADAGVRYAISDTVLLQLQANALMSAKSSGTRAEPDNTGGTLLTLSPGATIYVTKDVKLYAFYQRPIYQHVNGVQLSTTDSIAFGLSTRF
jgi:Putative MetA-pathway of phenol degradation